MPNRKSQYISASRRCDLPRFFYEQFFDAWRGGSITYDGGYGRRYTVSLRDEDVTGYIFWSKDFSKFIEHPDYESLISRSNALFHFTINDCPALEPNVPPVKLRLAALRRLCDMVGPQRVLWRFDPVCKYSAGDGTVMTTESAFFDLLPHMQKAGITRCYFSFMSHYNKTRKRSVKFLDFSETEKQHIAHALAKSCSQAGMALYNCCNEDVLHAVPLVQKAHCVDTDILQQTDRFGVHCPLKPAPTRAGCGCYESRDIGSYNPACAHGCSYCYAHPAVA